MLNVLQVEWVKQKTTPRPEDNAEALEQVSKEYEKKFTKYREEHIGKYGIPRKTKQNLEL